MTVVFTHFVERQEQLQRLHNISLAKQVCADQFKNGLLRVTVAFDIVKNLGLFAQSYEKLTREYEVPFAGFCVVR